MRPALFALTVVLAAPLARATTVDDALRTRCVVDARLDGAAAEALADPDGFDPRALRDRTVANHLPAPVVQAVVLRGGDAASRADALGRWLDAHGASVHHTRCAVAAGGEGVALAVVPRVVEGVEALPAEGDARRWRVVGGEAFGALSMSATAPDGSVTQPPRLADGTFSLAMPAQGVWTLQVMAELPTGPAPVARWTEQVGDAPREATASVVVHNDRQLLGAINTLRRAHDAAALRRDPMLDAVARAHAEALARRRAVAHTPNPEDSPVDRLRAAGIRTVRVGENVARARSLTEAHGGLSSSPAHRANLLDAHVDAVGVGIARADGWVYLVELFATRPSMVASP